jgi:hypothetical protein
VSIDPGLRACGVAVFENSVLVRAALVKSPERGVRGPVAWRAMADAVAAYIGRGALDVLVIEVPQVYQQRAWKGDPGDLIELAGVDGALVGALQPFESIGYFPKEWKGQVPKEIHCARTILKLQTRGLDEEGKIEPVAQSLRHNVVDAVGLGLFQLDNKSPAGKK